jgi:hypothetical protein
MRECVCRLQLLLVLAIAVILMSESRGTRNQILLFQIRDSPNPEGHVPVFISPVKGWPGYTPRHWVLFSSPPTTRRATVEVFEPVSTQVFLLNLWTILASTVLLRTDWIENTVSESTSIVACVSVTEGTCLLRDYLETALVYFLISRSLRNNGFTSYNSFIHQWLYSPFLGPGLYNTIG